MILEKGKGEGGRERAGRRRRERGERGAELDSNPEPAPGPAELRGCQGPSLWRRGCTAPPPARSGRRRLGRARAGSPSPRTAPASLGGSAPSRRARDAEELAPGGNACGSVFLQLPRGALLAKRRRSSRAAAGPGSEGCVPGLPPRRARQTTRRPAAQLRNGTSQLCCRENLQDFHF